MRRWARATQHCLDCRRAGAVTVDFPSLHTTAAVVRRRGVSGNAVNVTAGSVQRDFSTRGPPAGSLSLCTPACRPSPSRVPSRGCPLFSPRCRIRIVARRAPVLRPPQAARAWIDRELWLVVEYMPHTVGSWLPANQGAVGHVTDDLCRTISFLRAHGIVHFDAHLWTVLTDGARWARGCRGRDALPGRHRVHVDVPDQAATQPPQGHALRRHEAEGAARRRRHPGSMSRRRILGQRRLATHSSLLNPCITGRLKTSWRAAVPLRQLDTTVWTPVAPTRDSVVDRIAMAGRPEQPHNVAALVLSGIILVALAVAISSTWIDDGDGTCRTLYDPNFTRGGCARRLMPAALTAAVLVGAAVLVWDSAGRAARRPSRGAALVVSAPPIAVPSVGTQPR